MKKLFSILPVLTILFFTACEGPEGPPGFDGRDGVDGEDITGQVIERTGDFTGANNYTLAYDLPASLGVSSTDIVLIYLLWDVTTDTNGNDLDIWRLLPQTRILTAGLLQYNYDFTRFDVEIFLEADFDLATLPLVDTAGQTFRIVVLPAFDVESGAINTDNLGSALGSMKIGESEIKQIQF